MAGITLAQAEAQLALWLDADAKVSLNQRYEIDGRSYTRADAAVISQKIEFWDARVKTLSHTAAGRSRARSMVVR